MAPRLLLNAGPSTPFPFAMLRVRVAQDDRSLERTRESERWQTHSPGVFAFAVGDGGAGFAVGFAVALGGAFVPVLLALGDGQFAFDPALAKIEPRRNERKAF